MNQKPHSFANKKTPMDTPSASPHRLRQTLFFVLKLLLTAWILFYLIERIQWTALKAEFHDIRFLPMMIGFFLMAPNLWIQHIKWKYLVRIIRPDTSGKDIWRSLMCGFSIGLVTPGRLGEMARGLYIQTDRHAPLIGMGILDKMFSVIALALIALFGTIVIQPSDRMGSAEWLIMVVAAFLTLLLLTVTLTPKLLRMVTRNVKKAIYTLPLYRKIFALISATDHFHKPQLAVSMGYGLLFQSVIYIQFFWFLSAFSETDFFSVFFAINLAMFLKTMLPVAVMDLGVREGAVVFFLTQIGVSAAAAFNASLLLFFSNVLLPGIIGFIYLVRYHFYFIHTQRGGSHDPH